MVTRVLYAIDSLHGGGAETSLLEMVPALRKLGVEITIVTLLADDDTLAARIGDIGVDVRRFASRSWVGRLRAIRRELNGGSFDLLHTSLTWADLLGRIAAFGVPVPVVTSLVNSSYGPEHRSRSRYGDWSVRVAHGLDLFASRRTTIFHAISEDVGAVMTRRLRLRPERVRVAYRGRDALRLGRRTPERRDAVRRSLGVAPDVPLVLVVGRLDKQKAVDISLRAVAVLQSRMPDAQVLVVGRDGNAATDVKRIAATMHNVRLLGHRTDVADLMCAADCLSFPSRWEGLGGTLIEALALELPVVATDIGCIREVLGDIPWPLVRVDDPIGLASSLETVLRGDASLAETASRGRQRFEHLFTASRAADGMAAIYAQALEGNHK
jgi:glycosyltransferase involved in cell wall biosynthesis